MSKSFTVPAEQDTRVFKDLAFKDSATTYTIDFTPWADEFGDITTVTWTVKSGSAVISDEDETDNIATALITLSAADCSLIEITADTGDDICVAYLEIRAKEPYSRTNDYGFR